MSSALYSHFSSLYLNNCVFKIMHGFMTISVPIMRGFMTMLVTIHLLISCAWLIPLSFKSIHTSVLSSYIADDIALYNSRGSTLINAIMKADIFITSLHKKISKKEI